MSAKKYLLAAISTVLLASPAANAATIKERLKNTERELRVLASPALEDANGKRIGQIVYFKQETEMTLAMKVNSKRTLLRLVDDGSGGYLWQGTFVQEVYFSNVGCTGQAWIASQGRHFKTIRASVVIEDQWWVGITRKPINRNDYASQLVLQGSNAVCQTVPSPSFKNLVSAEQVTNTFFIDYPPPYRVDWN